MEVNGNWVHLAFSKTFSALAEAGRSESRNGDQWVSLNAWLSLIILTMKYLKCKCCQLHHSRHLQKGYSIGIVVSKIDMWAVVWFYVPVFLFAHSGIVGTQNMGIWGEGKGMPEPWWGVFKCSSDNQSFACVMIDYFLICISAPWVRYPWHSDFLCLSHDRLHKAVSSLPALTLQLKYREKEQHRSGKYCLLTLLLKITFFSSATSLCEFEG